MRIKQRNIRQKLTSICREECQYKTVKRHAVYVGNERINVNLTKYTDTRKE